MPVLGLVTIGQTPRPDLEEAFRRESPGAEVRLAGALDDLTPGAATTLHAPGDEYPLLVRLRDGTTAQVPRRLIVPRVEAAARRLAESGADLVVIVCAGEFPDISCDVPVLVPGKMLPAVAGVLAPRRRIGVITPIRGQVAAADAKWRRDGFEPVVASASPTAIGEMAAAAHVIAGGDVDLVVLDCMGHDETWREAFATRTGKPVIAARSLVARVTGEVLAGTPSRRPPT